MKLEVWKEPEGLTELCFAGEHGDGQRKLMEQGSVLIYSFDASSHYDAMTKYYDYMGWGIYTTQFEIDKKPYNSQSLSTNNNL